MITRLATGGMAELFLARERGIAGLERLVVIKRMLPHLAEQPSFVEMFLREARIAARLQHQNVVEIFDLDQHDGTFYIAMEYIQGSTARELQILAQKRNQEVPIPVAIAIVTAALRGLHAAHELADMDGKPVGLVHRDVSPHNLMCTPDGHVKLLDFGVAKATQGAEATYSGNLKGKFAYMSPEQCRRQDLDRRSDIFSMGVVLWELCVGERLFKRDSEMEMMEAVVSGIRKPLPDDFPPELAEILDQALAIKKEQRFQSAETFRQALLGFYQSQGYGHAEDVVGEFVKKVAGDQLARRSETLQSALERSLTKHEKRGLLHVTGTESQSYAQDDTLVDKDEGDPAMSAETVIAKHRESIETATADRPRGATETRLEDPEKRSNPIFGIVAIVVVVGILAGIAAILIDRSRKTEEDQAPVLLGEPIPIAWAPTVDPKLLREELVPLRKYLERTMGRPVPIEITKDYKESSQKLLKGEVAFALLPPLMYVRTEAQSQEIEPLGMKMYQGASKSDGLLLVRMDDNVRNLDALEGKRFCFTDENSTTGNFLPRAYLRSEGKDPEKFIGEVVWTGDHIQSLRDLIDGKCDAAATYSGALLSASSLHIPVGQIRRLTITGYIPQDIIVAGPGASETDKEAMRKALLSFDPKKEFNVDYLGETQRISGFAEAKEKDFADLKKLEEEAKLLKKSD